MNLLLDTHAYLWFITNDARLSSQAQTLVVSYFAGARVCEPQRPPPASRLRPEG